jgi:hypothetical protein
MSIIRGLYTRIVTSPQVFTVQPLRTGTNISLLRFGPNPCRVNQTPQHQAIETNRQHDGNPLLPNSEMHRDSLSVSSSDRFLHRQCPRHLLNERWCGLRSRSRLDLKFVILLRYWGSIIKEYRVSGTYADRRAKIFHRRTLTYSTPKKTHLGDGLRSITTNSNASPNDS